MPGACEGRQDHGVAGKLRGWTASTGVTALRRLLGVPLAASLCAGGRRA
ncbi:Hypothetical protein CAP_2123 [Chondromyces apiculatus DSM 436]|uniref:Uncharacterized protein n=1 Tax=Chondromyces apiculatus DSM 436 TaxID=1192034 RepID=A0A017TBP5_9BACT|nr:Hypothetical protein CAP_2123 [Chondromyces apiculatus DSM 436]